MITATCLRCGHHWIPRCEHPTVCPNKKCGSPYWDQPRKGFRELVKKVGK